jgi:hypothetical protein
MFQELRDSTVSAPELQPPTLEAELDTSILSSAQTVKDLSDIFHGVAAYLDDSVADRRDVRAYFTVSDVVAARTVLTLPRDLAGRLCPTFTAPSM